MVHLQESAPVRRNICYICRKVHQSGTFGTSVGKCIRQEHLVHLKESASVRNIWYICRKVNQSGGTFGTSVGKCIRQEHLVHLQESASAGGTFGTSVGKCISQEHLVHLQENANKMLDYSEISQTKTKRQNLTTNKVSRREAKKETSAMWLLTTKPNHEEDLKHQVTFRIHNEPSHK